MAIRKDSALYKFFLLVYEDGLDEDSTLTSIDDVSIENGDLAVEYSYTSKDSFSGKDYATANSLGVELFRQEDSGGFCCGATEIGKFSKFSPDIVIPQVAAAMKEYLQDTKMGLIIATTYHQPGAEKLLKASGFESKPFYNPNTKHTCTVWTWRRAGGR